MQPPSVHQCITISASVHQCITISASVHHHHTASVHQCISASPSVQPPSLASVHHFSKSRATVCHRWPRYYCAVAAASSPTGRSHYFLYYFSQQPRNIKQVILDAPACQQETDGQDDGQPAAPNDVLLKSLSLQNCYYLRRCHQHGFYKNLFQIVFSHTSYLLAPDTGSSMEDWIMTFCEHLDINCEEDQKPRPKNGRMQQYSLSNFRHSSIRQKFQLGDKGNRRPDSLPFPGGYAGGSMSLPATNAATPTAVPATAAPAFPNQSVTAVYSSPSTGSLDSSSSLGTTSAISSDMSSMSSQRVGYLNAGVYRNAFSNIAGARGALPSSDDESSRGTSTDGMGMSDMTRSLQGIITRTRSQDSLSQFDSGVSYGRDGTPCSILNPDNSDIVVVSTEPSRITHVDNPFLKQCSRSSSSNSSFDRTCTLQPPVTTPQLVQASSTSLECESTASFSSDSTLTNERFPVASALSTGRASVASASTATAMSSDSMFQVADYESRAMPHRTPAISGRIPQMVRPYGPVTTVRRAFSYGSVPDSVSARYNMSQKSAAEFKSSNARASPAFTTPVSRTTVNVKTVVHVQRSHAMDHLLLVDAFNYVWVAGWNSPCHPTVFHFGDRVLSINNTPCAKASSAMTEIQGSGSEVLITVVRTPLGNEVSIKRQSTSEILGLGFRKNTINNILPNTAAARSGISLQAQGMGSKPVPWVVTQINGVPVNLFNTDRDKVMEQLDASGFHVTLLLQPKDFVSGLKKKVRSSPHGKHFMRPPMIRRSSSAQSSSSRTSIRSNQPIIVQLEKSRSKLGIFVKGGADTPAHFITIDSVDEGGIAHADGFLKEGMEILAVDRTSLVGLPHTEAVALMKDCFASERTHLELVVKVPVKK